MNEVQHTGARKAILKTIAFFDTMDYPPTWTEVGAWGESRESLSVANFEEAKRLLLVDGLIEEAEGRLALHGRMAPLLKLVHERTPLFPRKLRVARRVTRWLLRNPNVRFVALANTMGLAHSRDEGDLDFFVVVRKGSIWSTRLLASGLYRLLGRLSGPNEKQDAVCLSYFISDAALDLSSHQLPSNDPYFRYWFLALLPLFDDGLSKGLWAANHAITSIHPNAEPWMVSPDLAVKRPFIILAGTSLFEKPARRLQQRWFPPAIATRMNQGTDVIVNDDVLKFHVDDGRTAYRDAYEERLKRLGVE